MRAFLVAAFLLITAAASAGDVDLRAHSWRPDGPKTSALSAPAKPWMQHQMLGDALGNLLGVHDGRWDLFTETVTDEEENGPAIAGTIRRGAAEIQLRWHPGE